VRFRWLCSARPHWTGRLVTEKGRAKLVGITRNITAGKNAEMALRESEERLRVLVAELQHRTRNLISVVARQPNRR